TITQQLAKNLWLSPSRDPVRKTKEGILTWQLERALRKRRILELYLNVAEFGPGVYGAEAASRHYFGKPASDLSEDEAAQLAASLDAPYGTQPADRRDIFPAERATPAPVHVFIHGGYWQWLDKKDFSYVARAFVPAGVATVVINYALMPTATMAELVRQCRA